MNSKPIVLRKATIIDGLNNKRYKADIIIFEDKIKEINKKCDTSIHNCYSIYCSGKIITPGFIDVHGHSDLQIRRSSDMKAKIQQGITTEIAGNCGIGPFPINLSDENVVKSIRELTKDVLGTFDYDFTDFSTFCEKVESNLPNTNILFLQSHTALRANVIKPNANRAATDLEIKQMCNLLDISLKQGCIGLSTGLYYAPCLYAEKKELIELLKVVKQNDKVFATHHRCEGDNVIESLKEVISLAKEVGVKLEVSHLKAIGVENQKYVNKMLNLIDEAKDANLDIGFDQYPYEFGSTSLYSLLPPDYLKLSNFDLKQVLSDENERTKIKNLIIQGDGWDSIIKMCGFDNIFAMYLESQRELENKSLREIALILKSKDDDDSCFEALFDILQKESGVALMIDITQSFDSMDKILNHPLMCFGTDAIYSGDEISTVPTHPRSYQAATHLIETFYKKRKIISLENLIHNMTYKSAKRFKIENRGSIEVGKFADLVVMDIDKVKDVSTSNDVKIPPEGIEYVFVNGKNVYKDKDIQLSHAGRILKQL
ncbi:MAG: amidohydrolase family protein [Sphaerochaetaceae bacterium]|nr:amidohydrolase family protein [Sphaerochaetaceae bacterium]